MWVYFQVWLDLWAQTKLWGLFSLLSPLSCPSLPFIFLAVIPARCGFALGMTLSHLHTEKMDLALLSISHPFLPGSEKKSDSLPPHVDIKNNGRELISPSWPVGLLAQKREKIPLLCQICMGMSISEAICQKVVYVCVEFVTNFFFIRCLVRYPFLGAMNSRTFLLHYVTLRVREWNEAETEPLEFYVKFHSRKIWDTIIFPPCASDQYKKWPEKYFSELSRN